MTSGALWAITLKRKATQALKNSRSAHENPIAQAAEPRRLQRWIFGSDLQASVKAMSSSPEDQFQ